jgi:hypothetical protein
MHASANPANVVTAARARFTFLTDRMVRIEWADNGLFEDLATLTVSNRYTDAVPFTRRDSAGKLILKTKYLTLTCIQDGKVLSKKNLTITLNVCGKLVTWYPGKSDPLNLKGTAKTLDEADGSKLKKWIPVEEKDDKCPVQAERNGGQLIWQGDTVDLPLCDGLISRSGWAVVDDSKSVVLDPALCDW